MNRFPLIFSSKFLTKEFSDKYGYLDNGEYVELLAHIFLAEVQQKHTLPFLSTCILQKVFIGF